MVTNFESDVCTLYRYAAVFTSNGYSLVSKWFLMNSNIAMNMKGILFNVHGVMKLKKKKQKKNQNQHWTLKGIKRHAERTVWIAADQSTEIDH